MIFVVGEMGRKEREGVKREQMANMLLLFLGQRSSPHRGYGIGISCVEWFAWTVYVRVTHLFKFQSAINISISPNHLPIYLSPHRLLTE